MRKRNSFCRGNRVRVCLLGLVLSQIWPVSHNLVAQTNFRGSATISYDVLHRNNPGGDMTVFINRQWGLRYTHITNVLYHDGDSKLVNNTVVDSSLEGSFGAPFLLKAIDYRSFSGQNKIGFDYATAYVGIGFNKMGVEVNRRRFLTRSGKIDIYEESEKVDLPLKCAVFGFYGGEKFVVVDLKLMYLTGVVELSDSDGGKMDVEQWFLMISIGLGN